jgi:hypothetical protein
VNQLAAKPRWAEKVSRARVRRLYETDAAGIVDDELIDEVGYALLARCESILTVTEAHHGRVSCPHCDALILREDSPAGSAVLHCAHCGWTMPWADYHRTYKGRQLYGGGAVGIFREFVARFPTLADPRAKMLAVDRLLHEFHTGLKEPGRPVAANLLDARGLQEVIDFLDALNYGSGTGERAERAARWHERLHSLSWSRHFVIPGPEDPRPAGRSAGHPGEEAGE